MTLHRTLVVLTVSLLFACNGARLHHLAPTPNAPGVDEIDPDANQEFKSARFSPDAGQIAFHALVDNSRDIVGVMNRDGTDIRQLATNGTPLTSVAWSPDGRFIFYTSAAGIEEIAPVGTGSAHLVDAVSATELDVSASGATMLWVKDGANTLVSYKANIAGSTPHEESHQGRYPRFDEDGAVPGFVYVGQNDAGQHPLERDLLGSGGSSGFVTMDLGAFPSVSVLGMNHYVITSPAGIERVTQAGMRSHISDEKAAMNVDASLDGLQVLYVVSGKPGLFIAAGF